MNAQNSRLSREAQVLCDATKEMDPQVRLFIAYFIQTLNATAAASMAHYGDSPAACAVAGCRLLKRPEVKEAVEKHLKEVYMGLAEMKCRMSEHARASMDDFLDVNEETNEISFNWARAKKLGHMRNIKKCKMKRSSTPTPGRDVDGNPLPPTVTEYIEIELFDAQDALVQIGKMEGLFKEHVVVESHTGDGPFEAMTKAYEAGRLNDEQKN